MKELLKECLKELDIDKLLKEEIKKGVEELIKSRVSSYFRFSGPVSDLIEKSLEEMSIPSNVDLIDYRNFITECCIESFSMYKSPEHKLEMMEFIKNKLGDQSIKQMSYYDFIEKVKDLWSDQFEDDPCNCFSEDSLKIEVTLNDKYGWYNVNVSEGDKKISSLTVSTCDNRIFSNYCYEKKSFISPFFRSLAYHKVLLLDIEEDSFDYSYQDWQESRY